MGKATNRWAALMLAVSAATLLASPSWAAKPEWVEEGGKGNGKNQGNGGGKHKDHDKGDRDKGRDSHRDGDRHQDRDRSGVSLQGGGAVQLGGSSVNVSIQFGDAQRRAVRDYYRPQVSAGHCPPGLAKKNNGCMPPGQAKAWKRGSVLPGGVVIYPIPRDLEIRLGVPPAGHKYVRVAADILLIAVGTSMVVDAIEDLAGL